MPTSLKISIECIDNEDSGEWTVQRREHNKFFIDDLFVSRNKKEALQAFLEIKHQISKKYFTIIKEDYLGDYAVCEFEAIDNVFN